MKNNAFALLAVALLTFSGRLLFAEAADTAPPKDQGPSVLVQLAKLEKGSLPRIATGFGRVETNPSARQTIQAPLSAVVDAVYVKPGQEVAEGAPLIRLGPSPTTASSYTQALSALKVARETERRTGSLLAQHLATGQQLAGAQKAVSDAQASLEALRAEGAASPRLLRAPAPTIVTAVSTSPGALVAQGAALLALARSNELVLRAGLVPAQAATVQIGDTATITPLGGVQAVSGRVLLRGSMIDPQTGLVSIDITLPPGNFLPGQMAEAAITTESVEGYVVPGEAILVDNTGAPYLFQVVSGVARKVPVRLLLAQAGKDVVEGALDPAAPLVLAGNHQLDNGMRVRTAGPANAAGE